MLSGMNLLCIFLAVVVSSVALGFWVAAWLGWMFNGTLRHFIAWYFLPRSIRADYDKEEFFTLDETDLMVSLLDVKFFGKLLTCPTCLSAWLAAMGLVFIALTMAHFWVPQTLWTLPLIWAGGAIQGLNSHNSED